MIVGTRQRILRATTGSLSWQPQDADGEPNDPGVVTVGVAASDGSVVRAAGVATVGTGSNPRTLVLTPAETGLLDRLTATWKVGAVTVAVTEHDIVGGYYFSVAELRAVETTLAASARENDAALIRARAEVEATFESACGVAFVPRFEVFRSAVAGQIILANPEVRSVRWAKLWSYGAVANIVTGSDLLSIEWTSEGVIRLPFSGAGYQSVEIGYEHGLDAAPPDVKRVAMLFTRIQVNQAKTSITDRATSVQLSDGGTATIATTGFTGIPMVDDVLRRYDRSGPSVG